MVTTAAPIDTAQLAPTAPPIDEFGHSQPDSIDVEDNRVSTVGLLAEYETVDDVIAAAHRVREAGFTRWDVHSPFPIHGIDEVIGVKPTILPWLVLGGGITGMLGGLFLTIWTMATSFDWAGGLQGYPYLISGKPYNSLPAFIPPIFELTILLAAFGAVFGMILLNSLPMLYSPLFRHARFRRVTDDRFFVVLDATDPKFDLTDAERLLQGTRPAAVERVED